jgi:hypothetical protein
MKKLLFVLMLGSAAVLTADEVKMQDGSVLRGKILSISSAFVELETAYAGALKLDRTHVVSFSTGNPVHVRLTSGTVVSGPLQAGEADAMIIKGPEGDIQTGTAAIKEGWLTPGQDPEILAREKAVAELQRKWVYQAVAKISGKSGNTDEKNMGGEASATLTGKEDELKFYGSYERKETEGVKTTDERKAGMRYTSYFNDPWGWYVRQEFENDEFENIQLRSVTAAGLSYRFFNLDYKKLSANAGLSYRYETYQDNTPDNENVGLDLGLQHFYRLGNRFEINNELTYIPSVEDFANYLAVQNSYVDFPLGGSRFWKVRAGLRNDYNSQPEGGRDELDTTYYSSLVVDWK